MKLYRLMFSGNGRRDEGGFSLLELVIAIIVMGLLLGMGVWMMYGSQTKHSVNGAARQVANDLNMCKQLASSQKRPWGAIFYRYNYVNATWGNAFQNKYRIFNLGRAATPFVVPDDLYATIAWNRNSLGVAFQNYPNPMPEGFSDKDYRIPPPGPSHLVAYISLPKGTITYRLYRPRTTPVTTATLYLRFVPVGSHFVAQYWGRENDGSPDQADVRWRNLGSPCEMWIRDNPGSEYKQSKVTIYPLGDVKVD